MPGAARSDHPILEKLKGISKRRGGCSFPAWGMESRLAGYWAGWRKSRDMSRWAELRLTSDALITASAGRSGITVVTSESPGLLPTGGILSIRMEGTRDFISPTLCPDI